MFNKNKKALEFIATLPKAEEINNVCDGIDIDNQSLIIPEWEPITVRKMPHRTFIQSLKYQMELITDTF